MAGFHKNGPKASIPLLLPSKYFKKEMIQEVSFKHCSSLFNPNKKISIPFIKQHLK
jgi:hypothetical protein